MSADGPTPNLAFHAPPGWPQPPQGWSPPPGWVPDPSWPPPPPGWVFLRPAAPAAERSADAHTAPDVGGAPDVADSGARPLPSGDHEGAPPPPSGKNGDQPKARRGRRPAPVTVALIAAAAVAVVGIGAIGLVVIFGDPCRDPSPGADLSECDFTGKDLSGVDLSGADLTRSVLRSAALSGAVLTGADLTNSDLSGADLSNATMESATMTDALLEESDLDHALLNSANLTGANLSGASLIGAVLAGANLHGANLDSARLSQADLAGADLTEADLNGASLDGAVLTRADLAYARLDGADVTQSDLKDADLSSATLIGAAMDQTDLQGTVGLTDAMLADALGVDEANLAAEALRRQLHFDDATTVLSSVAPAATGSGVQGAHAYVDSPAFHPLVVLGEGGLPMTPDWAAGVQGLWMPEALRFIELVAVTEPGREVVEDCGMYVDRVTLEEFGHLIRYRETIGVRVYSAATGQLVAAQVFRGPDPRACNPDFETYETIMNGVWGDSADYSALIPWLAGVVHPPVDVTAQGTGSVSWVEPGRS